MVSHGLLCLKQEVGAGNGWEEEQEENMSPGLGHSSPPIPSLPLAFHVYIPVSVLTPAPPVHLQMGLQ